MEERVQTLLVVPMFASALPVLGDKTVNRVTEVYLLIFNIDCLFPYDPITYNKDCGPCNALVPRVENSFWKPLAC